MRAWQGAALFIGVLFLAPSPAGASTIDAGGTTGPSGAPFISYRAWRGERNRVRVSNTRNGILIVDRGARRISGNAEFTDIRCRTRSRQSAVCSGDFDAISVDLRDRNDSIVFSYGSDGRPPGRTNPLAFAQPEEAEYEELTEAAYIEGGSGDDRISGTKYADSIGGGTGRDIVDGRGGRDTIETEDDGVRDRLRGGGSVDALHYTSERPVTIDLAAGTATAAGAPDSIAGFERVHGGAAGDVLSGSEEADALYGEGGDDRLDGRGGSDLLVGNGRSAATPSPNRIAGGAGNDFIHAATAEPAPTSGVDCGPGDDVSLGDVATRFDASCESTPLFFTPEDPVEWAARTPVAPVGRTADGSPIYEFHCPPPEDRTMDCLGRITLERPPPDAASPYGSGEFRAAPGQRVAVPITLTDEGRAAIAGGAPVAVRLSGTSEGSSFAQGWQHVLPR